MIEKPKKYPVNYKSKKQLQTADEQYFASIPSEVIPNEAVVDHYD